MNKRYKKVEVTEALKGRIVGRSDKIENHLKNIAKNLNFNGSGKFSILNFLLERNSLDFKTYEKNR